MSETKSRADFIDDFKRTHPQKDGWKVYKREGSEYWPIPVFLRCEAPEAIKAENISTEIYWSSKPKERRINLTELPFKPWLLGVGISEEDWEGTIELDWQGQPIHLIRTVLLSPRDASHLLLIATKDRRCLEDFFRRFEIFRKKYFETRTTVAVVNESRIPRPKMKWDDIILPDTMLEDIRSSVESFFLARKRFRTMGIPYRRGFLFTGPPGCGKTATIKAIAAQVKTTVLFFPIKSETSDSDIEKAFDGAIPDKGDPPTVLILEDIDRITTTREVSVSNFLNMLDGLKTHDGILVIATTNAPEKLDAALLHRPSRFDRVWHFGLPGPTERRRFLNKKAMGAFSEPCLEEVVRQTDGFTMAYVQEVIVNAFLKAIHEKRSSHDKDLLVSVKQLKAQYREASKVTGDIKVTEAVGFVAV